jgi:hypothetical protein
MSLKKTNLRVKRYVIVFPLTHECSELLSCSQRGGNQFTGQQLNLTAIYQPLFLKPQGILKGCFVLVIKEYGMVALISQKM